LVASIYLVPTYHLIRSSIRLPVRGGNLFDPYIEVIQRVPFLHYFLNSTMIVILTISVGLLVNSLLAYVLARMRWRFSALVLGVVVALMIIPFEALAVPLLMITNTLGWLDTLHVQIIPFIADPFSIFLFYQFFRKFPKDLEEAAMVDGLGRLRIFWHILLPNSAPVFATAAILKFLFLWDSYLWPVMVTRGPEARPLTVGFTSVFGLSGSAYAVLMSIPTLVLFIGLQRWFVRSVTATGSRG
jgi:multiple sugar transport system permease protein